MKVTAETESNVGSVGILAFSQEQRRDTEQLHQARHAIYKMLSLAYLYPGDIDWTTFIRELPRVLGEASEVLSLDVRDEIEVLADMASSLDFNELCCDHTALFINNPNTNPISPYESVYLEDTIMGQSARRVGEKYEQYGFTVDPQHSYLLPDHLALELDFMACLIEKAIESGSFSQDEQCRFFIDHPGKWMHQFLADVKRRKPNTYFSLLAGMANKFFQYEMRMFSSRHKKM